MPTRADHHSQADVERLFRACGEILNVGHPSNAEASWRMRLIIVWWLRQMCVATDHDQEMVVKVLTDAMNHVGIQTFAKVFPMSEQPQ